MENNTLISKELEQTIILYIKKLLEDKDNKQKTSKTDGVFVKINMKEKSVEIEFDWDKNLSLNILQDRLFKLLLFFSPHKSTYEAAIKGIREAGIRKNQLDLVNFVLNLFIANLEGEESNSPCVLPREVFRDEQQQ